MKQGTTEWHKERFGIPTSSRLKDVLTSGRGSEEFGATAMRYAYEILACEDMQEPIDVANSAIEWGIEWEPIARERYEEETFNIVEEVGFIKYKGIFGGSPDGLVGKKGLIEIKCPKNPVNHQVVLSTGKIPQDHIPQIQGNIMATERDWCDFISFNPKFSFENQIKIIRAYRDDVFISNAWKKIERFNQMLEFVKMKK